MDVPNKCYGCMDKTKNAECKDAMLDWLKQEVDNE